MTCGGTILKKITEKQVKHRLFTAPILGLDFVLYLVRMCIVFYN